MGYDPDDGLKVLKFFDIIKDDAKFGDIRGESLLNHTPAWVKEFL